LMAMIGTAVGCLGRINEIVPTVQDLGRRHSSYGVRDAHYEAVREALLWTLEQGLDTDWTPEVRDAWAAAYSTLSNVMKDAANESVGSGIAAA
jgi:hemoglobin-like flavoprotein